ncbi:DUF4418 family protein [Raoultibacter phocaeensis]|uniref:DUF4418 family protein n=1 Tax=Raoultibacter phocaeensis TaxID=2479841 RepID=UPI00111A4DCB|nr:DUF4418 family protein [Raoultibacter phocaeensis]
MKKNIGVIVNGISILCALAVVGAVAFWAKPCQATLELANGSAVPMRCAFTGKVALLLAVVLIVVCIASIATKKPMSVAVAAISIALIVLTFDTPISIGICKDGMACSATAFWLRLGAVISFVAACAGFALDGKRVHVKP